MLIVRASLGFCFAAIFPLGCQSNDNGYSTSSQKIYDLIYRCRSGEPIPGLNVVEGGVQTWSFHNTTAQSIYVQAAVKDGSAMFKESDGQWLKPGEKSRAWTFPVSAQIDSSVRCANEVG